LKIKVFLAVALAQAKRGRRACEQLGGRKAGDALGDFDARVEPNVTESETLAVSYSLRRWTRWALPARPTTAARAGVRIGKAVDNRGVVLHDINGIPSERHGCKAAFRDIRDPGRFEDGGCGDLLGARGSFAREG
jgi:hypothetical protein